MFTWIIELERSSNECISVDDSVDSVDFAKLHVNWKLMFLGKKSHIFRPTEDIVSEP